MKSILTSLSKIALAIIRPVLLFLTALFLPLNLNATSLWVGEKYTCDATSATMGNLYNISWSCSGGYISMTGSGLYRDIVITQFFNGEATVRCEWDYTLYYGDNFHHQTRTWTFSCRDNPVSISPEYMTLSVGETDYVGYRHQYSNSYTSYANAYFSCTSDVVSVTRDGEITANRPGTAYVYVYSNISSVSPYCTVTVKDYVPPTNIHIPATLSLNIDDTYQIKPTFEPSDAYSKLTWTSNNSTVASVDDKGVVTAKKLGTATIKVTTDNGLSAECLVTVKERDFSDGAVFRAKTQEGVDMIFKVISEQDKTCQVGADSIAIDYTYNGVITIPESVFGLTVTEIGDKAFGQCKLTEVYIPNTVKSIGDYAFWLCFKMEKVHLPAFLESIGVSAFEFCNGISKYNFTIPNSVSHVGRNAFSNTTWYNNQPNGVVYAGSVAYKYKGDMPENTSITLREGTKEIAIDAFRNYSISSADPKDYLVSIVIPNSVISIEDYAFYRCYSLKNVVIPNSVQHIGNSAFEQCFDLSELTIGKGVKNVDGLAFAGCSRLKTVNFNAISCSDFSMSDSRYQFDGTDITTINIGSDVRIIPAFFVVHGQIDSISIPDSVVKIGDYAFSRCHNVSYISIGQSVDTIGAYAFSVTCAQNAKVEISDIDAWCRINFNTILSNPLYAVGHLYLNGEEITSLVIPDNVKSLKSYVFNGCRSLTNISLPNSISEIGEYSFYGCNNLKEVIIPNSVKSIGEYAFRYCDSLSRVDIGNSVQFIGDYAFYGMKNLTNVMCRSTNPPQCESTSCFGYYSSGETNYPTRLLVPKGSIEKYRNAEVWKNFSNIEAIDINENGDVNGDGEVNIADINSVINMILSDSFQNNGDVNGDGEVNIADINTIINMILSK